MDQVERNHVILYKILFQLHQIVYLEVLISLLLKLTGFGMSEFVKISLQYIMRIFFIGKYLIARFAIIFARKGNKTSFGIRLHPKVGLSGDL